MIQTLRKFRGGQTKQIWGGQSRDIFRGGPVKKITLYIQKLFPFFFHIPDGGRGGGGVSVGTSSHLDSAVLVVAEPDAGGLPLHLVLATEGAQVLRVLRDLHLLDGLPQGSTIPYVPSISLRSN